MKQRQAKADLQLYPIDRRSGPRTPATDIRRARPQDYNDITTDRPCQKGFDRG